MLKMNLGGEEDKSNQNVLLASGSGMAVKGQTTLVSQDDCLSEIFRMLRKTFIGDVSVICAFTDSETD